MTHPYRSILTPIQFDNPSLLALSIASRSRSAQYDAPSADVVATSSGEGGHLKLQQESAGV